MARHRIWRPDILREQHAPIAHLDRGQRGRRARVSRAAGTDDTSLARARARRGLAAAAAAAAALRRRELPAVLISADASAFKLRLDALGGPVVSPPQR